MENQTNANIDQGYSPMSSGDTSNASEHSRNLLQQNHRHDRDDRVKRLALSSGKKSFLVFKSNKYISVLTKNIALFYIKYESSVIVCFDKQEYLVNYSLEQIQNVLSDKKFFRLNRQFLINFKAIKEVEHYFARKLVVNTIVMFKEKLLVPRERVTSFLHWLDNR